MPQHRPRAVRPHVAQEYQENADGESAASLARRLRTPYRHRILSARRKDRPVLTVGERKRGK